MMPYRRRGPRWWNVWLPLLLLLLGGLLVLEPQGPLSPGGQPIAQLVLALLMYGVVAVWLRCNRGALVNKAYDTGVRISDKQMASLSVKCAPTLPHWNYTVQPA